MCVLLVAICIAVLLAVIIDAAEDGDSTASVAANATIADALPRYPVVPEIRILLPVPTQPKDDASTRGPKVTGGRPGLMFCVVGENVFSAEVFHVPFCDYAVYPDLVAQDGEFLALYGRTSWLTFKKAMAVNRRIAAGLGFSVSGFEKEDSTVASIPNMRDKLLELVRTMNISAMGVLNYPRHLSTTTTNDLAKMFEASF
ncbi:uncharacterized protein LOC144095247 [Amblyomma americanum]